MNSPHTGRLKAPRWYVKDCSPCSPWINTDSDTADADRDDTADNEASYDPLPPLNSSILSTLDLAAPALSDFFSAVVDKKEITFQGKLS